MKQIQNWRVVKVIDSPLLNSNEQVAFIDIGKITLDIVAIEGAGYTREEHTANARLIAAAPELLEALEVCFEALNPGVFTQAPAWSKAKLAIQKAKEL